ncbi:MAG: pentapeptide repeat-containing protein [Actinomycetota bacterium]
MLTGRPRRETLTRRLAFLATAGLAIAALPAAGHAGVSFCGGHGVCANISAPTVIGTGAKTCVLKPGADCRGVVHRWGVEHHGNLRKAKFTKADLRGADFRGADLRGADFRGAKLRHADMRGASLRGARLGPVGTVRPRENGNGISCGLNCEGADMSYMDLQDIDLSHANLVYATILGSNLTGANLSYANLSYAILTGSTVTGWDITGVTWGDTVCPNGYQTYGPC